MDGVIQRRSNTSAHRVNHRQLFVLPKTRCGDDELFSVAACPCHSCGLSVARIPLRRRTEEWW